MPSSFVQHGLKVGKSVAPEVLNMPDSGATGWQVKASTPCLEGSLLAGICAAIVQASELGSCCYDWIDQVGLIVVGYPLQDLHMGRYVAQPYLATCNCNCNSHGRWACRMQSDIAFA